MKTIPQTEPDNPLNTLITIAFQNQLAVISKFSYSIIDIYWASL